MQGNHALLTFTDRRVELLTLPDGVGKIKDMVIGQISAAHCIEAVLFGIADYFFDLFIVQIVGRIAAPIHHHGSFGTRDNRSPAFVPEPISVTASAFPVDRFATRKLKIHILRVIKLPVIIKVKASAGGGDSVWQIHAKRPPANIIFVGAVIQQFSGSPFPEPVPVIVNHIVPIRGTWCRALPELIVEPVRHICNGSVSDGPALVRIETFGIIDIPDQPIPDILHRLLRFGRRALLISHLYTLSMSLLSLHNQSGFSGIMTPRLFYIDMLACL